MRRRGQSLEELEQVAEVRAFVGRERERALFADALLAGSAIRVILVVGPGGIGKSALLRAFERDARAAGHTTVHLDARDLAAGPGVRTLFDHAPKPPRRGLRVVMLDTAEAVDDERALVDVVMRGCGPRDRVIVASRNPPGVAWRTLASWGRAARALELAPLTDAQSRAYLRARRVGRPAWGDTLALARGYPLLLALACDAGGLASRGPRDHGTDTPQALVGVLCETLLGGVDDARREAFELAALVRTLNEESLSAMLPGRDGAAAFAWLRGLSFVTTSREGVFPHDVARDAVSADLRWRRPARWKALFRRAFRYWARRLVTTHDADFYAAMLELGWLARSAGVADALAVPSGLALSRHPVGPEDIGAIAAIFERFEGPESARLVRHWYRRQPEAFVVLRHEDGRVAGATAILDLGKTSAADRRSDPGVAAVYRRATELLGGELRGSVPYARFLSSAEQYQTPCPTIAAVAAVTTEPLLRSRDMPLYYSYIADPAAWAEAHAFAGVQRAPECDFVLDGRRFAVIVHDRRDKAPGSWVLEVMGRALGDPTLGDPDEEEAAEVADGPRVREVRRALRALHDPRTLAKSPLGRAHATHASPGKALQQRLRAAIEALAGTSPDDRLRRVVELTYVKPAPSQDHAARSLGMAPSTFRRHLTAAVARIAAELG